MAERRKRPAPKEKLPSLQSKDMPASERDFWDIEDDSSPQDSPSAKSDPAKESPAKESPAKETSPDGAPGTPPPVDDLEQTTPPRSNPASASLTGEGDAPTPAKQNTKRSKDSSPGRAEKISLIVLGVLLAGAAIGGLSLFFSKIPTAPKTSKIEFPVTGEFVSIGNVRTYWRRPDREKDRGIQQKARLIPSALVTLDKSSGQGALRFFFEDDSGKLIGDSTTVAFGNGTFATNNAPEAEIHATGGFSDSGEHAAYLTGQIEPWHLIIKEGPDRNASGRDFKEILRVPISVNRK